MFPESFFRKFYDGLDESNKIQGRLQVEPNLLKKGLMIAIHDPYTSEPSYKWQRGMVLSRITDTDFRVKFFAKFETNSGGYFGLNFIYYNNYLSGLCSRLWKHFKR